MTALILYDGVCGLCDKSVHFILRRDPDAYFKFASFQSRSGQDAMRLHSIPVELHENPQSLILIEDQGVFMKSAAALRIAKRLKSPWPALSFLRWIPAPLRDRVYDCVARNRYRWFGRMNTCPLPPPEWRSRFLTDSASSSDHSSEA